MCRGCENRHQSHKKLLGFLTINSFLSTCTNTTLAQQVMLHVSNECTCVSMIQVIFRQLSVLYEGVYIKYTTSTEFQSINLCQMLETRC